MYLRTTQRRNKDGSVARYLALAENVRDAGKGYVEARVVHSFGRADELDRAALERLVRSIRRVLDEGAPAAADKAPAAGPPATWRSTKSRSWGPPTSPAPCGRSWALARRSAPA